MPTSAIFQYRSGAKKPNAAATAAGANIPVDEKFAYTDANDIADELTAQRAINAATSAALAQLQAALGITQPLPVLLSSDPVTGQQSVQLAVGETPETLEIFATNGES